MHPFVVVLSAIPCGLLGKNVFEIIFDADDSPASLACFLQSFLCARIVFVFGAVRHRGAKKFPATVLSVCAVSEHFYVAIGISDCYEGLLPMCSSIIIGLNGPTLYTCTIGRLTTVDLPSFFMYSLPKVLER